MAGRGNSREFLKSLRDGVENKLAMVKMIAQSVPAIFGLCLLLMLAVGHWELLWVRILAVVLHAGYWVGVVIWGIRGPGWLNQWHEEMLDHQRRLYRKSDLLYLVLEHEQPEQFKKKQDWLEKLTSSRVPADSSFQGRIRWFLANYKEVAAGAGVSVKPAARIYRFGDLIFFVIFLPMACINILENIIGGMASMFFVFTLFIIPGTLAGTIDHLTRYTLAVATADVLLGDVETAPEGDEDAGTGENES